MQTRGGHAKSTQKGPSQIRHSHANQCTTILSTQLQKGELIVYYIVNTQMKNDVRITTKLLQYR